MRIKRKGKNSGYGRDVIMEYLLRFSQLIMNFLNKEPEMNPVKVLEDGNGILIINAKTVLSGHEPEKRKKIIARFKKVRIG